MELPRNLSAWRFALLLSALSLLPALSLSLRNADGRTPSSALPLITCSSIECPPYQVVYEAQDFAIRLYNESVWMSTAPIDNISFYSATQTGFLELFEYIQGKNEDGVEVNMTAPVLTGILPSDGPFCASTFLVRFYVPEAYHVEPPVPDSDLDLQVDRWGARYFAVRQFGGFATDSNIAEEAANLEVSLSEAGIGIESASQNQEVYMIAQYDSPFEISGRVNEVWLPLSNSTLSVSAVAQMDKHRV